MGQAICWLRIPVKIGDIIQKVALARFARTLGTRSATGVPILQALKIIATSSGNYVIEQAPFKSRESIREGLPIYHPLEDEWVFPPMVTRMMAVGEETGDIDGMLTKIAQFYESEVDAVVKALRRSSWRWSSGWALVPYLRNCVQVCGFSQTRRE